MEHSKTMYKYNYRHTFIFSSSKNIDNEELISLEQALFAIKNFERLDAFLDASSGGMFLIFHIDSNTNGLHKNYFTDNRYKGAKVITSRCLTLTKLQLNKEEDLFSQIASFEWFMDLDRPCIALRSHPRQVPSYSRQRKGTVLSARRSLWKSSWH